jgi:hypothetical protein
LPEALAILAVATFAPNSWFTALTHFARSRRIVSSAVDAEPVPLAKRG